MANQFYTAPTTDEITQNYFPPTPTPDPNAQPQQPAQPDASRPGFFSRLSDNYAEDFAKNGDSAGSFVAPLIKTAAESFITPPSPNKSFLRKIGEDAVALGAGIPLAIAHPIQTLKAMVIGGTPEDGTLDRLKQGGLVQSLANVVQPDYYKEHPLLGVFNTGSWIATVASFGLSKVVGGVIEQGAAEVAEQAANEVGMQSARTAVESSLTKSLIRTATDQAIKTGDMSVVTEVAKNALLKAGFEDGAAAKYADSLTSKITTGLADNANKINVYSKIAHPIDTAFDTAKKTLSPVAKMVFGEPDKSAVARLYGNEMVAKDPQGFSNIEDWASKQVIERGLKDTVDNRQSIMNEWASTVSEWSTLTPEQKVAYHQNYIEASDLAAKISEKTGDLVVPTKFLSPKDINAIIENINSAPATQSPIKILDSLGEIWNQFSSREAGGGSAGIWRNSIEQAITANPTKEGLVAAIESLGKRYTLNYSRLPEVNALVKQMEEQTGYKVIEAPKGKPISFATAAAEPLTPDGIGVGKFTESLSDIQNRLIAAKTKLGAMVDRLGLSAQGGVEGTLENLYADQFSQNIIQQLGEEHPNGIKLNILDIHTGEVAGQRTIPLEKLYEFLDRNKNAIQEGAPKLMETRNTVSDISSRDLQFLGMDKATANQVVQVARNSLVDLPFAQTGLMEGVVNYARAKVPGFNKFLNLKFETHFNLNPFYAARYWFKTEILKSMNLNEPSVSFGRVIDERLQPIVQNIPYLKDIIAPKVGLPEIKLMADEVLYGINKNVVDFASNPELMTLEKSVGIAKSIQSRNIFLRAMGYNIPYDATAFGKAIADKFGMTLQDALSSRVENGVKIYNNPAVFNEIRNSVQSVFHYEPGLLTSPLMKTINTIWFPARFETKVLQQTAKWIGNLSPVVRLEVVNNMIHTATWAQTPEGLAWRKQNKNHWETILNYLLPYQEIGDTVGSVLQGQLFNGKTGMLGGLPFGMVINTMQDLSIIPGEDSTNPITGATTAKRTPKKLVSKASAAVVLENFITQILPSLPLYTWFGGTVTPFKNTLEQATEGALSTGEALFTGQQPKKVKKELDHSFKTVKPGYTRY